jgi:flagellar assembly protein FliH
MLEGSLVQAPPHAMQRDQLIATAQAEADAIRETARAQGYAEGGATARAEALAQLEPAHTAFLEACATIERHADDAVPAIEQRAVALALALAEKILATALELDPSLVCNVVAGALRRVVSHDRVVLAVNPDDVELVQEAVGGDPTDLSTVRRIEIVPERRVPRGGCIVRTSEGEIDARIEQQLDRAATLLRDTIVLAA